MLNFIIKNLLHDKEKLMLSVGGTTFCVLLIVILQSILTGIIHDAGLFSKNSGADIFITQSGVNKMLGAASFINENIEKDISSIDGVKEVQGIYGSKFSFDKEDKKVSAYLIGYDKEKDLGEPWRIYSGRKIEHNGEIIIDKNISAANDIKLDDVIKLSGEDYKVVGLSEETNVMANQYIFVLKEDAEKILLANGIVNFFLVNVNSDSVLSDVIIRLEKKIDSIDAFTKEEFSINNENVQKDMIGGPLSIMVAISLGIGIMIVALTTYTSTISKIKDYTILKALGVKSIKINIIIFTQTIINCSIGLIIGIALSYIVSSFINNIGESVSSVIRIDSILISIMATLVMSIVASFISSKDIRLIDAADVFK